MSYASFYCVQVILHFQLSQYLLLNSVFQRFMTFLSSLKFPLFSTHHSQVPIDSINFPAALTTWALFIWRLKVCVQQKLELIFPIKKLVGLFGKQE